MGASALVSVLNAVPWEDEDDNSSDEEDERQHRRIGGSLAHQKVERPKGE